MYNNYNEREKWTTNLSANRNNLDTNSDCVQIFSDLFIFSLWKRFMVFSLIGVFD